MGMRILRKAAASTIAAALFTSALPLSAAVYADDAVLLGADFESGTEGWSGRGSASAAVDKSKGHDSSSSLFVSKRTNDWNGAITELGHAFSAGNSYGFETYVMYDSGDPSLNFKLSLEYSSGGTTYYDEIALTKVNKGEWTKVSNPSYTIPSGAEGAKFYVEVPDSLTDFYIDDVKITGSASASHVATKPAETVETKPNGKIKGDLDGDGMITAFDLILMRKNIIAGFKDTKMKKSADIDKSGTPEIADLVQLQCFLLGKIAKFEEVDDPVGEEEKIYEKTYVFPSANTLRSSKSIPDPFVFMDGSKVEDPSDWGERANEISCMYEYYMYGKWRDGSDDEVSYKINGSNMTISIKRKSTGKTTSFPAKITLPKTVRHEGGAPVIVGMHTGISEETAAANGYAVITIDAGIFSNPVASDDMYHKGAFYDLYPYGNKWEEQTGALMGWSWGCSKILDALYAGAAKDLNINPDSSIVTGVSRWGKAAAVCGAFDKRFKMCAPSCSGAGGLALYRYMSQGKTYDFSSKGASSNYTYTENEPLGSLQATGERGWFNDRFLEFRSGDQFPMDQHMLGSLCADKDRYLFIIGSCVGEDWVNAPSMWASYLGMRHVWDYLDISDHLAINIHKEGHAVIAEDVNYMVQYFDYHVYGIQPKMDLSQLQTSVFAQPRNTDPFVTSYADSWTY